MGGIMCHRRGDWSRTSDRASESDDERERDETPGWTARAADRLATFLSVGNSHADGETPERPVSETTPTGETTDSEADETEDEREEPIPADD
ncbi:hypothetical protein [Halorussus salinisoli]|uniref:hypothetical protein n=1 Tax=Halorussus salinisoli TaxID=2558242 RepID=UPI0010C2386A|nr:hypothetical protein [Halorussus salinisoli]